MSSSLRNFQKRVSKHRRKGLNTRGEKPGPAQMPSQRQYRGHDKRGLQWLSKNHDLKHADKKCRICHGAGVVKSAYVKDGMSKRLACSCVPMKPKED